MSHRKIHKHHAKFLMRVYSSHQRSTSKLLKSFPAANWRGRAMGLRLALALCMDHCAEAELADDGWFKTVVLAGGTACLPGLPDRMEKEMQKLLPSFISEGIHVLRPPYGVDSAWFGVEIISNVSTFSAAWCV